MTISPKLLKGGIVLVDPGTGNVQRVIALQYNPETLTRSLQVQGAGGEGGDRSEAQRLPGPPVETFNLEAELDAADQLESPYEEGSEDVVKDIVKYGLHSQLAALETIVYPSSSQLQANNSLAKSGTLEIFPMESPLTLFIWSVNRVLPMRLTEFSITEEAFDTSLNPIRAKVSLGMRVLTVDDLGFNHKGGSIFMTYLQNKEQLATKYQNASFSTFGIGGIS